MTIFQVAPGKTLGIGGGKNLLYRPAGTSSGPGSTTLSGIPGLANLTSNLNVQVQANSNLLGTIGQTIADADDMVQGLNRHWLLRSAFKAKTTNAPATTPVQRLTSPRGAGQ